jgi:hypothetical protein
MFCVLWHRFWRLAPFRVFPLALGVRKQGDSLSAGFALFCCRHLCACKGTFRTSSQDAQCCALNSSSSRTHPSRRTGQPGDYAFHVLLQDSCSHSCDLASIPDLVIFLPFLLLTSSSQKSPACCPTPSAAPPGCYCIAAHTVWRSSAAVAGPLEPSLHSCQTLIRTSKEVSSSTLYLLC